MRLPNPEDWPLSQRSVAGPEAAPRTPFLEIQSEEGITIVFLPVPCGADVLPLSYFRRSVPHMVPPISVNDPAVADPASPIRFPGSATFPIEIWLPCSACN